MYDALTLAAICDELNDTILDGRVQRVLLLDPLTVGLEVYAERARHQLLMSAEAREARIHLVGGEGDGHGRLTGDAARVTPLLLLLRKYVRGARLVRVYQPAPLERVVFLRFAKFFAAENGRDADAGTGPVNEEDEDEPIEGDLVETTLAVEIMGRHSNLILIGEDGRIMDSAKRVPPTLSRVRPVLPHGAYAPVPPQEK
ncbi:MAG: NFACT family protein, partial [Chloroflexota bacterium]|nr:NFACT family protein [Chloroflexota bacterium]